MGDSDNAQNQTAGQDRPTVLDRASGDKVDRIIDREVKEGGPEIPGQDQQTKIDRASGDKVDRMMDRVEKESGPKIPGLD